MRFKYKAQKEDGSIYEAEQEAADKFALFRERKREGETVIAASEVNERFRFDWSRILRRRVKMRDRIVFARNLSGMIGAGLPLSRALAVLLRQTRDEKMRNAIAAVLERVGRGSALCVALDEFPDAFPPLVVSMVKAGEESGNLSGALLSAAEGLERSYLLMRKVRGALVYPAVVIVVMVVVGILLFIFVVPQLTAAFSALNIELPFSTRVVIGISELFKGYGLLFLAAFLAFLLALFAAGRSAAGKRLIDRILLRMPVVAPILREVSAARVSETLASLLSAGVPIVSSLGITAGVIGNVLYKDALAQAQKAIERGEPISAVLREHEHLFPLFLSEMVAVGEETGKLSATLREVGIFFEAEVEQRTKNLSTIIEPALMVVVGIMVGFFAIAMITPMYSLMDSI